jgi:hypothetical protein
MIVKSAQPGEDGGCTPSPFYSVYSSEIENKNSFSRSAFLFVYTKYILLEAWM